MNNEYCLDYSLFAPYTRFMASNEIAVASDSVTEAILKAALLRFEQYGYSKTTMSEIAGDCDMSAANIYRYFQNKLEIGAQLTMRCLAEERTALTSVIAENVSAAVRLEQFVLASLKHTFSLWAEKPRINELVEAIARERVDVVNAHVEAKRALLTQLIEEGSQRGEFAAMDAVDSAHAVHVAITLFSVPLFMQLKPFEEFEALAVSVANLMLGGLLKRANKK